MKKVFLLFCAVSVLFGASVSAYYPHAQNHTRIDIYSNPVHYHAPVRSYDYYVPYQKPFNPRIMSSHTEQYSDYDTLVVDNVSVGDSISFYPDFTTLQGHDGTTWRWHYDSKGLNCREVGSTLECVVVDVRRSDVWGEFFLPKIQDSLYGDFYRSNEVIVQPKRAVQPRRSSAVSAPVLVPLLGVLPGIANLESNYQVYKNLNRKHYSRFYYAY